MAIHHVSWHAKPRSNMTYHIVIVRLQGRRIWHRALHDPALRLIFGAYKVLNLGLRRNVARRQFRLPVLVRPRITPLQHALQLLVGPGVEVNGFDLANMRAHTTMYAGATYAHEDAEVPAGPSGVYNSISMGWANHQNRRHTLVPLAVGACLVSLELHQVLEGCAILFRPISGRVGPP